MLAALATIGLGLVLGPEAPLIALGGGLGMLGIRLLRKDAPPDIVTLVAACGTFSAVSMVFGSPMIAAIVLIEATGIGGRAAEAAADPGLLAAGIGSLVSIGMGSFTGLSNHDYAITALSLPTFARPDVPDFLWTFLLSAADRDRLVRDLPDGPRHREGRRAAPLPHVPDRRARSSLRSRSCSPS